MGIGDDIFYDPAQVAILPMVFCFLGYDPKGANLLPPPFCASTWRKETLSKFPNVELTIIIGG